jgi:hypothetical protein
MQNLYWKTKDQSRNLLPKPFKTEADFEAYVFKHQDLLGDVYILYRQIHTGNKQGIPDMLGVDQDSHICLIEMKNVPVGEEILPQVLGYAMWAETNPDSIKAIWLEAKNRPDDVQIDWDSLEIRNIVVAPSYKGNVVKMAAKINYPVNLVQIQRFSFEEEEFVLVETLEDPIVGRNTITKPMGDWSWEYYEKEHGKEPAQEFQKVVNQLDEFVKNQGWSLLYNLNKNYTGFKLGSKVVFDVSWESAKLWSIHMKIPPEIAGKFQGKTWKYQKYEAIFKNSHFRIIPGNAIDITELHEMLKAAYRNVSGI